jgi:cell division protein FtsB
VAAAASPVGRAVPRVRFVLVVLALLGGSLVCLLVINTTLGAASFRISQLQQKSASLSTEEQNLRQQVAAEQAPAAIAARAYALGMRAETNTTILDLRSGQIDRLPGQGGMGVQLGAPPARATSTPAGANKSAGAKPSSGATPGASHTPAATTPGTASPSPSASRTPVPAKSSP